MTEKTLNTRILLRNGSLNEWSSDSELRAGEVALVRVDTARSDEWGNITNVPTYLMKVGAKKSDGSLYKFSELNWLAAPASDVHAWAKAASKPTYNATEIKVSTAADAQTVSAAITALEQAVGSNGSVSSLIDQKISAELDELTLNDTVVANEFVTAVTQSDGKIAVTRRALTADDIPLLGIGKITGLQAALDLKATVADLNTLTVTVQGTDGNGGLKQGLANEIGAREQADEALGKRIDDLNTAIGDVANIMNFKGVITTDPATITTGYNNGDVVIFGDKEFVFSDDNRFHEFGDASGNANAINALDERVDTAESKIAALEELKISSTYATKTELTTGLEGKVDNTTFNTYKTTTIEPVVDTVGDKNSGLVKDVADLKTAVGEAKQGQTAGTGLTGRVEALETASATHATTDNLNAQKERIDAVYTKFGDGTNLADVLILDCGTATTNW